jgi:hypothetical protein
MPRIIDSEPGKNLDPAGNLMQEYLLGIDSEEEKSTLPTQ